MTDYDRLDAAFADLNGRGILARQNYEQTLTSGAAAVWKEIRQEQVNRPVRGFVFFHEQDTEQAVRCDGPVLAWGRPRKKIRLGRSWPKKSWRC